MKKLINAPENVVDEALAGMAAAHADLIRVEAPNIVVRRDAPRPGKVGVISGGGSGHEPMHGGFVGMGMLDAACPGAVFTSPVPDQMLAATKAVDAYTQDQRVVGNSLFAEARTHGVAVVDKHDVEVARRHDVAAHGDRRNAGHAGEQLVVARGGAAPGCVPGRQLR